MNKIRIPFCGPLNYQIFHSVHRYTRMRTKTNKIIILTSNPGLLPYINSFTITYSTPQQMLCQMKLGLWPKVKPMKSPLKKYLALKNLDTKALGLETNFHPCFPSIAQSKACRFKKFSPLSSLLIAILPHDNHLIPFPFVPHQYEFNMRWISSHNDLGRRYALIIYVGIDCSTYLTLPHNLPLTRICHSLNCSSSKFDPLHIWMLPSYFAPPLMASQDICPCQAWFELPIFQQVRFSLPPKC